MDKYGQIWTNMCTRSLMEFMNDRLNDFDNYPFGNPSIIISTLITVRDKLEISNYNLNTLVKQINQCNIQSTP